MSALAVFTSKLAKVSATDARARWRPVLTSGSLQGITMLDTIDYVAATGKLTMPIQNVGRGPVIFLRTELDPASSAAPRHRPIATIAPGAERTLVFERRQAFSQLQLLLDYRDLAGHSYATAHRRHRPPGLLFRAAVEDRRITHRADEVNPQPGLQDVEAKGRRFWKRRKIREYWRSL